MLVPRGSGGPGQGTSGQIKPHDVDASWGFHFRRRIAYTRLRVTRTSIGSANVHIWAPSCVVPMYEVIPEPAHKSSTGWLTINLLGSHGELVAAAAEGDFLLGPLTAFRSASVRPLKDLTAESAHVRFDQRHRAIDLVVGG